MTMAEDKEKLEIEVVTEEDDVVEKPRADEDAPAKALAEGSAPDDDLQGVSDKVQARIKKLTFAAREAERQREQAIALREEAIKYAKSVSDQNRELSDRLNTGQTSVVESRKQQLQTMIDAAKERYRKAYEAGDADGLVEAQDQLASARAQLTRVQSWRPRPTVPAPTPEQYAQQRGLDVQQPQLNAQQRDWLAENDGWFGVNPEMTGMAYGLHEKLVRSGVDPNSQTYYTEIDKGMRSRFPEYFQSSPGPVAGDGRQKASVVAPATRDTTKPRTVRLSGTELEIARRLGVPPEEYAAQKLKVGK